MTRQTKLTPPAKLAPWQLLIRIGYPASPEDQRACMDALWDHGCWVGEGQPGHEAWAAYQRERMGHAT